MGKFIVTGAGGLRPVIAGSPRRIGDVIALADAEAKPALDAGVLVPIDDKMGAKKPPALRRLRDRA